MKNLAFHSLLGWKLITLPILTTSLTHFSLKGWENVLFWTWEWKGYCNFSFRVNAVPQDRAVKPAQLALRFVLHTYFPGFHRISSLAKVLLGPFTHAIFRCDFDAIRPLNKTFFSGTLQIAEKTTQCNCAFHSQWFQISPTASLERVHHTVWRTSRFIAYSTQMKDSTTNSHYLTYAFLFRRLRDLKLS